MVERHVLNNIAVTDRLVAQNKERGGPKRAVVERHLRILTQLGIHRALEPLLDVGCREGYLLNRLAGVMDKGQLFGVDVSEKAIHELRNRGFIGWVMDVCAERPLPTPLGKYNTIVASHVLEHCPYPRAMLRNLHRAMSASGLLYVEVPKERVPKVKAHGHFCAYATLPQLEDTITMDGLWVPVHRQVVDGKFLVIIARSSKGRQA